MSTNFFLSLNIEDFLNLAAEETSAMLDETFLPFFAKNNRDFGGALSVVFLNNSVIGSFYSRSYIFP